MTSGSGSNGGGASRLPIFQDDLSFNDRRGRSLFDDMQRHMDEEFSNMGLRSGLRRNKWGRDWDDDSNSIFKDFFELRPRNPKLGKISREDASSRESLDDNTTKTLFIEDPQTKTRMFQISFNVQEYSPEDISVKVVDDSLLVEAKHVDSTGGAQSTREFSRKIAIPKEVDPDKLSSTMSNDGILTIKAPVPPKYQSITGRVSSPTAISIEQSVSSAPSYAPSSTAQGSYHGSYQAPYTQPMTQYQDPQSYAGSGYPSSPPPGPPPHSSYYAPPPATQPRMSAPVPQMQPPPMGPQSPSAHTMTSAAPHAAMYYAQQPFSPTSMTHVQEFPPPPPPHMYAAPPMTTMPQDFPVAPPPQSAPQAPVTQTLDIPTYVDTPTGRRMDLTLFLGPPYTPEDILVKVDGKTLMIEACHMEKKDKKTSKASMSREFELAEDINPQTVQANLTNDGHLKLAAMVPVGDEAVAPAPDDQQPPASTQEQK